MCWRSPPSIVLPPRCCERRAAEAAAHCAVPRTASGALKTCGQRQQVDPLEASGTRVGCPPAQARGWVGDPDPGRGSDDLPSPGFPGF